jgi:hypothetical protein
MNLNRRQQLLGLAAITVLALLAGDRLLYSPLSRSWKARTLQVAELKKSVTRGTQLLERESSLRAKWSAMRTNMLSGEASAAENQMLKAFDRWSQESRVGVSSIRPQKRTVDDFDTMECRVEAFGSLPAICRFLYEIENDPLGIRVEAVELSARDTGGEQLTLGLQVSGLTLAASSSTQP